MKKVVYICIISTLFLFSCKKEKEDPRDKYVGEYEGKGNVASVKRNATLKLSKHPNKDNALIIDWATLDYFSGSGNFSYNASDGIVDENIIYLSNTGFLYLKNTLTFDLHKNCNYVEPDSLYIIVSFPLYSNSEMYLAKNYLQLKKKQ